MILEPTIDQIEPRIAKELDQLITMLANKEEIVRYKELEKYVHENKWINHTIEQIKKKQKELVQFEHYDKPEAHKKALEELAELNRLLDENITVKAYRASLEEANDIVQFIFKKMQDEIDMIND